jgi:hypothetical protein
MPAAPPTSRTSPPNARGLAELGVAADQIYLDHGLTGTKTRPARLQSRPRLRPRQRHSRRANDAQKTMGVITLTLITAGTLHPGPRPPVWVILLAVPGHRVGNVLRRVADHPHGGQENHRNRDTTRVFRRNRDDGGSAGVHARRLSAVDHAGRVRQRHRVRRRAQTRPRAVGSGRANGRGVGGDASRRRGARGFPALSLLRERWEWPWSRWSPWRCQPVPLGFPPCSGCPTL